MAVSGGLFKPQFGSFIVMYIEVEITSQFRCGLIIARLRKLF
jgi:hypothetical protein